MSEETKEQPKTEIEDIVGTVEIKGILSSIFEYYGRELNSMSPDLNVRWKKAYDAVQDVDEFLDVLKKELEGYDTKE